MSRAVIDQPGVRIVAVGLALSLFLGLALKSQISQPRVHEYLDKSIAGLQSDFYVDYGAAQVHLSNWGLPLPALVIENIRLSPKSTICQSSQIFINELEIPISLGVLAGFSKSLPKLRVKEIELRLSDVEKCVGSSEFPRESRSVAAFSTASTASAALPAAPAPSPEAGIKNIFKSETKAELKEIYIEKLKLISSKKPDQPVLFRQINIDLGYADSRLSELGLKAKLSAFKDPRSDIYFLNSNLTAVFKAQASGDIESLVNVSGKLLDGDVKFSSHGFSSAQKISYELAVSQVSVKALQPLFGAWEFSGLLERTPVSLSLVNRGEIRTAGAAGVDSVLSHVVVNIDNGVLKAGEISFSYADGRFSVKPFMLMVESLALSKLKNIEEFKKKLDSFESLGELSGVLQYRDRDHYGIKGHIKNVQAIFSNKGRRDLQRIDSADFEVTGRPGEVSFSADHFVMNQEPAEGRLTLSQNLENHEINGQLRLSGAILNPKVWEQFTFVEQSPKVDVLWTYKRNGEENHNLRLHFDKIGLPGMDLENLNVDLTQILAQDPAASKIRVVIHPSLLKTGPEFLSNAFVNQILNSDEKFQVAELTSAKTSLVLTGNDWKNLSFQLTSSFVPDKNPRAETRVDFKGNIRRESGLTSRLALDNKLVRNKFDLFTGADEELVLKPLQ